MQRGWRTVRIFLSSTFRDMHAERDHLVKAVFPKLREWCAQRQLHLVDIDLRWGVTPEQVENNKVLEICLQEIDGSRPFFVCMLGNRYGWIPNPPPPDEDYLTTAALGSPLRSYTHLEIEHALDPIAHRHMGHAAPAAHAFFYFRDPSATPLPETVTQLTPEQRAVYASVFFERDASRAAALAALKQDIARRVPERVRIYTPHLDATAKNPEDAALTGRLIGFEAFGRQIYDDLTGAIAAEFAEHIAEAARLQSPAAAEDWFHDAFAQQHMLAYVARPAIAAALSALTDDSGRSPIVVAGEPGSGKTTLLAAWSKARALDRHDEIVVMRFVGASVASTSLALLLRGICEEVAEHCGADWTEYAAFATDPVALAQVWTKLIDTMVAGRAVTIVIDGIDQLESFGNERWIPRQLPTGFTLVTSIALRPGQALADLRLDRMRELRVPALASDERAELIRRLPNLFCKTLAPAQIASLLANEASRNPLFLAVALEELRVCGAPLIDAAIADLPRPADEDSGAAVDELFARVIARMEREASARGRKGLAETVFTALAAARHGLADAELTAIAAEALKLKEEEVSETLQIILRQLRAYLVRKNAGSVSITDFFHMSFRRAAAARYLPTKEHRRAAHAMLARFFAGQPDDVASVSGVPQPNARKAAELPYQYVGAENRGALEALLTNIRFVETKCRADLVVDLQYDYSIALGAAGADRDGLRQYAKALATFAAHATQPGSPAGPSLTGALRSFFARTPGPPLPPPPSTQRMRDALAPQQATNPPALEWFARFVATHRHLLSAHPDYTVAIARNAAANSAASLAAEAAAGGLMRDPRPVAAARSLLRRKLIGHTDKVTSVAIAASGAVAVSASDDGTVRLWDPTSGAELARMSGHRGGVFAVAIGAEGNTAVSGGEDGILRVWDLAAGAIRDELRGHTGAIRAVALSADGGLALSIGEDDIVRLWDVASRHARAEFALAPYSDEPFEGAAISELARSHAGDFIGYAAGLSADGKLLVVSLLNAFYGLRNEQPRGTLRLTKIHAAGKFANVELPHCLLIGVAPDGTAVVHEAPPRAKAADSAVFLLDADGHCHRTRGIVPAGMWVAAASDDGRVVAGTRTISNPKNIRSARTELYLIDVERGAGRQHDLSRHHPVPIRSFAMTPDASLGVTGGSDGTICVFDLTGRDDVLPTGHDGRVYSAAISQACGIASCAADDNLHIRAADGTVAKNIGLEDGFHRVALSPDNAVVWGLNSVGRFYRVDVAQAKYRKFDLKDQYLRLNEIARTRPCAVGAGEVDHRLYMFDEAHGGWRFFEEPMRPLGAPPTISDDGAVAFTAHLDGSLRRWDPANGSSRTLCEVTPLLAVIGMTAGGRAIYSLALDGRLSVLEPQSGKTIREFSCPACLIRLDWDMIMNVHMEVLFPGGLAPKTWTLAVADDGQRMLVVAPDDTVRLWDLGAAVEIGLYAADQEITAFAASADLARCCVGTADGQMHLLHARPGQRPIALEQARLGRVRSGRNRAGMRVSQRRREDIDRFKRAMSGTDNRDPQMSDAVQQVSDMADARVGLQVERNGGVPTLAFLADFRAALRKRPVGPPPPAGKTSAPPVSDDDIAREAHEVFIDWLTRYHHGRGYESYRAVVERWNFQGGRAHQIAGRYRAFAMFSKLLVEDPRFSEGLPLRINANTMEIVPRVGAEIPLMDEAAFKAVSINIESTRAQLSRMASRLSDRPNSRS
jgi:WD40 repeat protein